MNFKKELDSRLELLKDNPRMCRRSDYFDDASYRDMTFKGYTVIYRIVSEDELKVRANSMDIPYQSYSKMLLKEGLKSHS